MAHCVNRSSKEFRALAEQSNINPIILAAKVSLWQEKNGLDKFPSIVDITSSGVNMSLKSLDILSSQKAIDVFSKGEKNNWSLDKILSELQIPKEQKELILQSGKTNIDDIVTDLLANYSYAVEINTATDKIGNYVEYIPSVMESNGKYYTVKPDGFFGKEITKEEFDKAKEKVVPTKYYSNLTVPGGTNYTENEIATPAITPSIKGHAQFATDQGIGWFRSDEQISKYEDKFAWAIEEETGEKPGSRTRRILEVQSDLFQKGRDEKRLIKGYNINDQGEQMESDDVIKMIFERKGKPNLFESAIKATNVSITKNKFLQLLNKDNNWVTFFIKSIIQDSAKKGYEKVLFPSGNTASKVEGHTTLEEFKREKENRIADLEKDKKREENDLKVSLEKVKEYTKLYKESNNDEDIWNDLSSYESQVNASEMFIERTDIEINQLKQELERVEGPEGFGALKPIYNFYENTVKNILNKQYGKENVKQVTDEYGNTWNEIDIKEERDTQSILLQTKDMSASKASEETVAMMRKAAEQMGIDIQDLLDYAKANPNIDVKNVNGLADLIKGVVAIAQGKENVAITEEIVHIATAILEQTNPRLITQLISKIDRFKIYKQVLAVYSKKKEYQLANGKPDIRKIKKEAVDKLIAELIVYQSEGSTEFPELMEERNRSMIQKWWETILDYIRGVYSKSNIDIFNTAASQIATGEVGATYGRGSNIVWHASNENISQFMSDNINGYFAKIKGGSPKAIFFTGDKAPKESFLSKREYQKQFAVKMNNPLIVDTKEGYSREKEGFKGLVNRALENGHDGVIVKNVDDNGFNGDVYISLDASKIKPLFTYKGKQGVFFSLDDEVKSQIDHYYNTVMEHNNKLELFPETVDDKRHYKYKGVRVAKSVTEKVKEKFKKAFNRTEAEKLVDDQKREWGSEGHRFIEQYIVNNLIDKDGYVRDKFGSEPIKSKLSAGLQVKLGEFAQTLINSYPEGTRFLIEKKVVNTKVKGMIASAVDFKAVYPVKKKDGTQGMKVDNLDWKFTTVDKSKEEDLSWFKIREWVPQMGEYTAIDYNYGLKRDQIGKARMIPFILNYENSVPTDKKSPLIPTSIEIGKLDALKETNMYLLPVPTLAETTGNSQVDALVNSLQTHYEKLFKRRGSEETEFSRRQQLSQLSRAIRNLHIKLNFEPLYNVAKTFLDNAKVAIRDFEDLDFNTATEEEIKKGLSDLLEYQKSADKFANMDQVFLSQYPKVGMTEENKKILSGLEDVAKSTERMQEKILDLLGVYAANLAVKQGIVSEENKMSVTEAEVQINKFAKTWAEGTKLSAKLIKLASNLLMNAASLVNRETSKQIKAFGELLIPLEESARAQGKNAFDLIGKMTASGPELIKKIDKEFLNKVKEARENKDKFFLMDNMDMKKFNELAKDYIEKNLKIIDNTKYYLDPEDDARMKEIQKKNLRNSIDINRDTFTGYNDYNFLQLFNQSMIEEGHYSKEYENMARNEAALNMWKFMTALNERGKKVGYLQNKSISFFPLIEATTLQKFGQTSNLIGEAGDFFKGLYSTKINEEQSMSKIDPETGKVKKVIPKYFTKTDKAVNQLSTDLNKVGTLWIKALLDYESAVNMEDTLQALLAVEKAKGSLIVDENGSVQFDSSNKPIIQEDNNNYQILETIVDDGLYKLEQDLSSFGNLAISNIAGKFSKTEEGKQKSAVNLKKGLNNLDTLVRALGVGLKPLIAIANWSGGNFQAYINAGGLYKFWTDFTPNNVKVSTNQLSLIERGLLDFIVPLNEDVVTEERRKLARKQGLIKYLSTWSFSDVMMATNSFPEKKLQLANALSIIDNSMVKDGKIVNIRQYLAEQDRQAKYNMSESERRDLERTFEDRVKELKESSSLTKTAKIENNEVVIPGVSEEELAKFRTKIVEYGRKLNGQMSRENKAGYKRDAIFNSFMMFKTWIPKLVAEHISDVSKNVEVGNWEYGRTRAFVKTWSHLGLKNVMMMRDIINGTDEGLRILDEILEEKRQEYFRKTGQELEITKEEFYDLMRKELTNQMKELKLLVILMAALMVAKAAQPPDDASDLEKNRYKWWAKALNKISDEVTFYYNPLSFEGMTKGSVLPSLTLLTKVERVFIQFAKEFGDEPEKAHTGKALFNLIPGLSQFQTEVLPYVDPEAAKEWGIRVSSESRSQ